MGKVPFWFRDMPRGIRKRLLTDKGGNVFSGKRLFDVGCDAGYYGHDLLFDLTSSMNKDGV